MADQLYLSLWFPNFRLAGLPAALRSVLEQFARIAAEGRADSPLTRVAAATVYPIDWTESPTWQRIFVNDKRSQESDDSTIAAAVAEATEQLHDDCAYEFEMHWQLWLPDLADTLPSHEAEQIEQEEDFSAPAHSNVVSIRPPAAQAARQESDEGWSLRPVRVRITGFGPEFDAGAYDTSGHIRVDFGLDTPWTFEGQDGLANSAVVQRHIRQNVEKLLAFTLLVEKHSGISSRLLWTESGEPLAEKLVAQLQRVN